KYAAPSGTMRGTESLLTDFGQLSVDEAALKRQYYQEMLEVYGLALWRQPFDMVALYGKANACYHLARYEDAYDTFRAVIRYAPTAAAYAGLGKTCTALQRYEKAVAAFQQA